MTDHQSPAFEQLDFLYTPSSDVAADAKYFSEVLGGRMVFTIEAMGTRVAMIELTKGAPTILLTDHLEGDRPIMVYRVADLEEATTVGGKGLAEGKNLRDPIWTLLLFFCPWGPSDSSISIGQT